MLKHVASQPPWSDEDVDPVHERQSQVVRTTGRPTVVDGVHLYEWMEHTGANPVDRHEMGVKVTSASTTNTTTIIIVGPVRVEVY